MAVALRRGLSGMGLLAVTSVGAIGVTRASQLQMGSPFSVGDFVDDVKGRQPRQLQATDSCAAGTSVYVSSLLLSDTEGCYEFDAEDAIFVSTNGEDVIASFPISDASDAEVVWVAGSFVGSSSLGARIIDAHCHSYEYISEVDHPGNVELWLCDVDNNGAAYTEVSPAEFSTECGCSDVEAASSNQPTSAPSSDGVVAPTGASTTPSPAAVDGEKGETTAPAHAGGAPTETAPVGGPSEESTTPSPAAVDGGKGETTAPAHSGGAPTEAAPVGGPSEELTTPSPAAVDGGEGETTAPAHSGDAPTETAPVGGPSEESTTPSPAAVDGGKGKTTAPAHSGEASTTPSPAAVDGEKGATSSPNHSVVLETPSPAISSRDIGTISPAVAPTELCPELGSFTISVAVPALSNLEGCYMDTGVEYEEEGGHFFSMDGVDSTAGMAVFPGYADAKSADPRWFVGFFAEAATNITVSCVSAESPAQVHPADATWHCDVAGNGTFPTTPDGQVSFDCGCLSTSSIGETTAPTIAPPEMVTAGPTLMVTAGPTLAPVPTTSAPTDVPLQVAEGSPAPTPGNRAIEIEGSAAPTPGSTGFNAALNSGPSTFSRVSMAGLIGSGVVAVAVGMLLVAV